MSQTFRHEELLARGTSLELDEQVFTITLCQAAKQVVQQRFTESEYRLLALFFTRGTAIHCTYDEALSVYINKPTDVCKKALQEARRLDQFEETHRYYFLETMNPVIEALEDCQERLHTLSLHMCVLVDHGYIVVSYEEKQTSL